MVNTSYGATAATATPAPPLRLDSAISKDGGSSTLNNYNGRYGLTMRPVEIPLATENLPEDTDRIASPPFETGTKQSISVLSGVAACCSLFLLTSALLMTSSHSEGRRGARTQGLQTARGRPAHLPTHPVSRCNLQHLRSGRLQWEMGLLRVLAPWAGHGAWRRSCRRGNQKITTHTLHYVTIPPSLSPPNQKPLHPIVYPVSLVSCLSLGLILILNSRG